MTLNIFENASLGAIECLVEKHLRGGSCEVFKLAAAECDGPVAEPAFSTVLVQENLAKEFGAHRGRESSR